ncbi:hypothetical protein V6N12_076110 [Hibiscus sabdariffa]|uniref:Uncharacterized protein n=1 Tax=Hibiscus sabdariffa TaxID=183260 RepID=A0ABR2AYW7_9ROSI
MYGYINSGRITLSKENSLPRSYVVKTRSTRPSSSQKPENFDRGCICPSSQPRELRIQLVGLTKPTFISLLKQSVSVYGTKDRTGRVKLASPLRETLIVDVSRTVALQRTTATAAAASDTRLELPFFGRSAEERKPGTIPHFGTLPSAVESVQVGSGQSGGTLAGRIAFESKDVKQQALKLQEKRKSYNCYNRNADTLKGLRHQRKRMI